MLQYWAKKQSITSSADDLRTLSLHVLTGAGFGKYFTFEGHDERDSTVSANHKNSLQMILEDCILIMALGPKALATARPWLPKTWKLGVLPETCAEFQQYTTEMYEEEKAKAVKPDPSSVRTLISSLVSASQAEAKTEAGTGLTESEIYGNMFMLNFTGHDTTAHTFTFAIHFLAAYPDVQTWVSEEIHSVHSLEHEWNYTTDFPRLVRCLAIMLETLRLYAPVPVAKWTANSSATLRIDGKTAVPPPNTMFIPSYTAVHTEPAIWGADSLVWRPSRWVKPDDKPGEEELVEPPDGSFLGWSEGARNCPAKRFSQVEFVAAVATLLRDWHVNPVPANDGESLEDAQKRVLNLIETDSGAVLLLQMLHPERASLTLSKRSG